MLTEPWSSERRRNRRHSASAPPVVAQLTEMQSYRHRPDMKFVVQLAHQITGVRGSETEISYHTKSIVHRRDCARRQAVSKNLDFYSDNGNSRNQRNVRMNEIPDAGSFAALLLLAGAVTALAAGVAILLAESWFQKMRQRREQFKTWQDRQRRSFLWLSSNQERGSIKK